MGQDAFMTDELYMREALRQAAKAGEADEVPIGAVIVHQNKIIAKAHNQVELLKDPTAHAEMIAITQATNYLQSKWLQDCTLYVTIEPCSMCTGALVLARITRLVFGASDEKTGACGSVANIAQHAKLNHRIDVAGSVLQAECGGIVSEFFRKKRKKYG
jgi:tRNA(adenine34) deaminase